LVVKYFISLSVLLIGIIVPVCSNEQSSMLINQYSVKILTEEDGFVSTEIYSIMQDKQGLLWFGPAEKSLCLNMIVRVQVMVVSTYRIYITGIDSQSLIPKVWTQFTPVHSINALSRSVL